MVKIKKFLECVVFILEILIVLCLLTRRLQDYNCVVWTGEYLPDNFPLNVFTTVVEYDHSFNQQVRLLQRCKHDDDMRRILVPSEQ